jgi:NAD-dependent deacetylase
MNSAAGKSTERGMQNLAENLPIRLSHCLRFGLWHTKQILPFRVHEGGKRIIEKFPRRYLLKICFKKFTYIKTMMKKLVVLTGAGISAESGLQTFRDVDGLWENHKIEDVATPGAWKKNPQLVLDFYNMRRKNVMDAKPNAAHYGLAELQDFFDVQIITQNIDDLHERAGSKNVLHLHGEILKMRSDKNESLIYPVTGDIHLGDMAKDGAQLRPHIVWFEEPVPMILAAIPIVESADIFVVVGTSLAVYPASGLVDLLNNGVRKYIIDRRIPYIRSTSFTAIEKPATEGIVDLKNLLLA